METEIRTLILICLIVLWFPAELLAGTANKPHPIVFGDLTRSAKSVAVVVISNGTLIEQDYCTENCYRFTAEAVELMKGDVSSVCLSSAMPLTIGGKYLLFVGHSDQLDETGSESHLGCEGDGRRLNRPVDVFFSPTIFEFSKKAKIVTGQEYLVIPFDRLPDSSNLRRMSVIEGFADSINMGINEDLKNLPEFLHVYDLVLWSDVKQRIHSTLRAR